MSLQEGDWVRTELGEIGKIVHVYRLTAFVDLKGEMNNQDIQGFLLSTLTKVDPPKKEGESPP
jgi:hypothetical protein